MKTVSDYCSNRFIYRSLFYQSASILLRRFYLPIVGLFYSPRLGTSLTRAIADRPIHLLNKHKMKLRLLSSYSDRNRKVFLTNYFSNERSFIILYSSNSLGSNG